MAGWRAGFALGNAPALAALARLKSYLDYGTFQPIQIASIVALNEARGYPAEACEVYRRRRDILCDGSSVSAGMSSARSERCSSGRQYPSPTANLAHSPLQSSSRARRTARSARRPWGGLHARGVLKGPGGGVVGGCRIDRVEIPPPLTQSVQPCFCPTPPSPAAASSPAPTTTPAWQTGRGAPPRLLPGAGRSRTDRSGKGQERGSPGLVQTSP
jgi:hypothetical protein